MPGYGITNYGAIDSGLAEGGPTLVTVVGVDRLRQLVGAVAQDEKDRRERWLDAFQAALDRDYPGFGAAVVERMFLNARSMANFLNTPQGAVYGFAPTPFDRGDLVGRPALAEDAAARALPRLLFRPVRRLQRRDAVWRRRRADGDAGARGVSARILCPCQSPCAGRRAADAAIVSDPASTRRGRRASPRAPRPPCAVSCRAPIGEFKVDKSGVPVYADFQCVIPA